MRTYRSYVISFLTVTLLVATCRAGIMDKFKKKDDPEKVTLKEEVVKSESKGAGNLRYSVSVADIEKSYDVVVKWDLKDAFKLMLTDALASSDHFIVLGVT